MRRRHGEKAREPQLARERAADEVVTAGEVDQRHCVKPGADGARRPRDHANIVARICSHFCNRDFG